MQVKPYPESKRRMLIERTPTDFITFLEEIKYADGKRFVRESLLQKQVRGFRDGNALLKLTVPTLIKKLKNEQELTDSSSHVWDAFAKAWMYWVKSHPELDDLLTGFDNKADFDKTDKCIAPPNSELDVQCFAILLEASRDKPIHQEMVRCFYEYGYFNEAEEIESIVDQFPSCEEVELREAIERIPNRIDELSNEIDRLSRSIEALNSRVNALEISNIEEKIESIVNRLLSGEERETKERLEGFSGRTDELSDAIDRLSQSIEDLDSRVSANETDNVEQKLTQRIAKFNEAFNSKLHGLKEEIKEEIVENRKALNDQVVNNSQEIRQMVEQQGQDGITKLNTEIEARVEVLENRYEEAVRMIRKNKLVTDEPKTSHSALKKGEQYRQKLQENTERYEGEEVYLGDFCHALGRLGLIDSGDENIARAIHIALKAFPAIEIDRDQRIIKAWRLMCDDHFNFTRVHVGMGWFGWQDWFPGFFAEECFEEKLERGDLRVSMEKLIELGDMPWVIHMADCDRSFPDSYLPPFLDWVDELFKDSIKVFLTRTYEANRCQTGEDFYARVARLPTPKNPEPIEAKTLRSSKIPLTLSEWKSWCQPNPDANPNYEEYDDFLQAIRLAIEDEDVQVPMELLREIRRYLRLSHKIMADTQAFDWALTLRLLPWIGNRYELINVVQRLIDNSPQELRRFQHGLQMARESNK